jgi:hypothetical protein
MSTGVVGGVSSWRDEAVAASKWKCQKLGRTDPDEVKA